MNKINILITIVIAIVFSGCYSEKILRTKPTTFIHIDHKPQEKIQYHCIDYNETKKENIEVSSNQIKCSGYTTLSIQNIKDVYKNHQEKMINDLLYVSNQNCNKFVERFKYNFMKQSITNKFLGLNFFGIGVNIGGVAQLTNEQFVQLNDTLTQNLMKRKEIRKSIEAKSSKSVPIEELLLDFIEYDKSCSLVNY